MQAHHTTCGWLAVEWHLGLGGISLLNFCNAYSSLHGNKHCPLPGDVYGSLPGNICQCPAWARLQSLPGTLASSLPGNACQCACPAWACLQSLPGTLASSLLGTLASSLPGNVYQCPAWARFAVPAWDALPVPCLGTFANALPGHVCQSLPGNAFCRDAVPVHVSHAYLHLFKPDMPRTPPK